MAKSPRGYRTIMLALKKDTTVPVYASARVADALQKITSEMPLYEGVKLKQILEAAYMQGKKDGARDVIEKMRQDFEKRRSRFRIATPVARGRHDGHRRNLTDQ